MQTDLKHLLIRILCFYLIQNAIYSPRFSLGNTPQNEKQATNRTRDHTINWCSAIDFCMTIYRKVKDALGSRIYLLGLRVYELRKTAQENAMYLFGIKVRSKRPKRLVDEAVEQKIRELAQRNKDLPESERLILCFDCLYDPLAEAIDAWTLFEYLQKQGIPSRYALLRTNPLYKQLQQENRLKDILPVDSEADLLIQYPDIIAACKRIFFSFPFTCSRVLLELPSCPFIFIEHGVSFLKPWSMELYTDGGTSECNYILTPTQLTSKLYTALHLMQGRTLHVGMPRWDKLPPIDHGKQQRDIFIFFTWRVTFMQDKKHMATYIERIADFVSRVEALVSKNPNIRVHVGLHHALMQHCGVQNISPSGSAGFIHPTEISAMIRETDLFITDYSSVCFDLMYRDVPTIFYRFDSDLTYSNNMDNEAAQSAAEKDSELYNCFYTADDTLHKIEHYIHTGFRIEDPIRCRNNEIFWQRSHNCRRLLELTNAII